MQRPLARTPALVVLALTAAAAAQEPITLVPASTGATMTFEHKTVQKQTIDAQGEQMEVAQNFAQTFTLAIVAASEDGKRTVKLGWSRINGSIDIPMQDTAELDTDKDGKDETGLAKGVRTLVGKDCTATIDADGQVTAIQGLAELAAAARQACGAGPEVQMLDSFVGERAFGNLLRSALGPLPKQPTAIGGTWQRTEESGNQVPMVRSLTLELRKADATIAEIGVQGTITARPGGRGPMADAELKDGRIEGTCVFSRADGFALNSVTRAQLHLDAMQGQVSVDILITTTLQRAPAKAAPATSKDDKPHGGN